MINVEERIIRVATEDKKIDEWGIIDREIWNDVYMRECNRESHVKEIARRTILDCYAGNKYRRSTSYTDGEQLFLSPYLGSHVQVAPTCIVNFDDNATWFFLQNEYVITFLFQGLYGRN